MQLLRLEIEGFRGVQRLVATFNNHVVFLGPNGSGKSTIIDALSLVFGRTRLVRDLTEHDFYGSTPEPISRIKIIATLGGFPGNDPDRNERWFRDGRAVPKWWNPATSEVEPQRGDEANHLCAQVAFAARFDLEDLCVEQVRYFHDDESVKDPFQEDALQQLPHRLLDDVGYYVLPARRTWEGMVTFASELFRKAVATSGGIPAETILAERDRLRHPTEPLENDSSLTPLVARVNAQLQRLLPRAPQFQLRVTATDSDSLLRALVPHYADDRGFSLPLGRHGTGLLSLQSFILLLELGRARRAHGQSFILAMEEPELHIPPGLQRRLVAQAVAIAEQTICTTHSPQVASIYPATSVQILSQRGPVTSATPMLPAPLQTEASNAARKLFHDDRVRVVEALMYERVLIPEGRTEYEWFRLLSEVVETTPEALQSAAEIPPFSAVIGIVPTHDGALEEVYRHLNPLRRGLIPLGDGDAAGRSKLLDLSQLEDPPEILLQWQDGWEMEDVIGWILRAAESSVLEELQQRLGRKFQSMEDFVAKLKVGTGSGRLKGDYLAYEEIAAVIAADDVCRARAARLLGSMVRAALGDQNVEDIVTLEGSDRSQYFVLQVQR